MIELSDYFSKFNYTPIALPMSGFVPLQLLLRDTATQSLQKLGDTAIVTSLFETNGMVHEPYYKPAKKMVSMKGGHLTSWKGNISFFSELLSKANIKIGAQQKQEVLFVFDTPTADEIESRPVLENYLNNAQIDSKNIFAKRLFRNELYIITNVLKTKKLAVAVVNNHKGNAQIQLPIAESLLDGSFRANADEELTQIFHYDGDEPIAFALQAVKVQLTRSFGEWLFSEKGVFSICTDKAAYIVRGDDEMQVEYLKL